MAERSSLITAGYGVAAGVGLVLFARDGLLAWPLAVGLAVLVGGLTYVTLAGPVMLRVLSRVGLALLPVVAVAGGLITLVIIPNATLANLELQAASIAGTAIASGWLATFVATEYKRSDEREVTRIDALNALETEVFSVLEKLDGSDIDKSGEKVAQDILAGGDAEPIKGGKDQRYFPFVGAQSPPTMFDALSDRIVVFESKTLTSIVRFYAAYSDLRAMIDDRQGAAFRDLPAARRAGAHRDLTTQRRATFYWGIRALYRINRSLPDRPATRPDARKFTNEKIATQAISDQKSEDAK